MRMTRQHFELIAKVVSTIDDDAARRATALNFFYELQRTNPNFKEALFLKACGC